MCNWFHNYVCYNDCSGKRNCFQIVHSLIQNNSCGGNKRFRLMPFSYFFLVVVVVSFLSNTLIYQRSCGLWSQFMSSVTVMVYLVIPSPQSLILFSWNLQSSTVLFFFDCFLTFPVLWLFNDLTCEIWATDDLVTW